MSSSSIHLQITVWLLIISPIAYSRIFPTTNQTLILPLTTQNSSSSLLFQRSRLVSSPSIKVPFTYDVALTVSLTAGSPPQSITMVLDTGSELSWLKCKQSSTSMFHHVKSSSYSALPCSSPVCTTKTQDFSLPASCDKKTNLCHVVVGYADGSTVEGNLAQDTFTIGSSTTRATAFGCMDVISSVREEDDKRTGLMGMNRGRLSFVNQMGLSKFSYCISGSGSTGVLVLGESSLPSLPPLKYTPLVTLTDRLPYSDRFAYTVNFEGIRVGSKLLPIPKSDLMRGQSGSGQTMLDSGTQFTFLRAPVYKVLKTEFTEQTKSVLTVDPSVVFEEGMELCFRVGSAKPDFSKLPAVTLMFEGAELTVSGQKLLYPVPGSGSKKYCFTFGNSEPAGIESFIIGNLHQQNVWVEYDLAHKKIGFANGVKCNQASQQLL
ncbi:hypothetical protein CARUB_v10019316mg [Capsella rubella]|uniref:Peptidase A1 domain-containing protein n=1 Tax=Capsella rubella TaxID=81985 RepID=R0HL24_9BRAS|nr:aspartic proteinase PCS1 [Capsella rubella]EOA25935.1 hypothetical protein CARUB_v10019316mg [Capsella rubella]